MGQRAPREVGPPGLTGSVLRRNYHSGETHTSTSYKSLPTKTKLYLIDLLSIIALGIHLYVLAIYKETCPQSALIFTGLILDVVALSSIQELRLTF